MAKKDEQFTLVQDGSDAAAITLHPTTAAAFSKLPQLDDLAKGQGAYAAGAALRICAQAGANIALKGTYRVVANGKALTQVKNAPGLFRGFIQENGKIVQQAKFKPVNVTRMAMLAVAVLEVATVVTCTVHLQDIAKQLKAVKAQLKQLHDLVEDQRLGRLLGNLEYLQEICHLLQDAPASDADLQRYAGQLESIYRDCLSEIHTSRQQIERRKREVDQAKTVKTQGQLFWKKMNEKDARALEDCVIDFSASLETALLAQEIAVMSCAAGQFLDLPVRVSAHRLQGVREHVDALSAEWQRYGHTLQTKFEGVSGRTDGQAKLRTLTRLVKEHRERPQVLTRALGEMQERLASPEPLEWIVKVEGGEIVDLRQVSKTA